LPFCTFKFFKFISLLSRFGSNIGMGHSFSAYISIALVTRNVPILEPNLESKDINLKNLKVQKGNIEFKNLKLLEMKKEIIIQKEEDIKIQIMIFII